MATGRHTLSLLMATLLCWVTPQASSAARSALSQPNYSVDTVFIYSNGQVEKLLEKNDSWYLLEDMRKRRYKRDINFTIPTLEYRSLTSSYLQSVSNGDPDTLFPLDQSKHSSFTVIKKRANGDEFTRNWSCSSVENSTIKAMGKSTHTFKTTCSRNSWSKQFLVLKEQVDFYYDPKKSWVVKTISHKSGKSRTKQLIAVLPPGQATPLNIMRIVRKLRNKAD
ncbi:MAG: hypothetical protein RPU32_00730 [Candidatus Sedimenticola sp. (ex Thyasira tokunagai)]